jgi:DNA-binding CsgD family transcriptional regulator
MLLENLTYLVTFVSTCGITATGILVTYRIQKIYQKPAMQVLLYQQIFFYSYLIYAVWINLAFHQFISGIDVRYELIEKINLFLHAAGLPFLIVSWIMLLKFGFNYNSNTVSGRTVIIFSGGSVLILAVLSLLFQNGYLEISVRSDLMIVRMLVIINLISHLIFILPFYLTYRSSNSDPGRRARQNCFIIYFPGVLLYSGLLWINDSYGFITANLSFLFLYAVTAILPFCFLFRVRMPKENSISQDNKFSIFCKNYDISKRESEIIIEICSGKTNKAIAEKLFITLQTVKDHTHRIYTKTNVKSRIQLANLVRKNT